MGCGSSTAGKDTAEKNETKGGSYKVEEKQNANAGDKSRNAGHGGGGGGGGGGAPPAGLAGGGAAGAHGGVAGNDVSPKVEAGVKAPAPTPDAAGGGAGGGGAGGARAGAAGDDAEGALPYREKNIPVPLLREVFEGGARYYVSHYAPAPGLRDVTFALRSAATGEVSTATFTDAEFQAFKEQHINQLGWNLFWRALHGSFTKDEGIRLRDNGQKLELSLKTNKDPTPYSVLIPLQPLPQAAAPHHTYTHFIEPFLQTYSVKKAHKDARDEVKEKKDKFMREEEAETKEAALNIYEANISEHDTLSRQRDSALAGLRTEAQEKQKASQTNQAKVDKLIRGIRVLKEGRGMHPLDGLYSVGGARAFQHTEHAHHYVPKELDANMVWLRLMEDGRVAEATPNDTSCLTRPPTDPEVEELVDGLTDDKVWQLIECFEEIDKWNYDCFHVDEITEGRSLFYTAYALFLKYGFIEHFKMNKEVVFNFLKGIQAGYCPNRYHNSMHAADVLQITHFCLGPGGMREKLRLSMEDCLAAVISAAVHDYNHPGLNNNFHTKVSAYLGTLYNDRSILENHHCSCVFEMTFHKKYDLFQFLGDDQRKDVRDTMVEMLLSTDMGNHAKIFSAFKRRMADAPDWGKKKEDVRLALVMAIKLADISNCSRPTDLYLKWANRIADEFYLQGEAEQRMGLAISPFMDRRKHDSDFHKGQVSFMNYIVVPLFDNIADLFPNLKFTVDMCAANREYWMKG